MQDGPSCREAGYRQLWWFLGACLTAAASASFADALAPSCDSLTSNFKIEQAALKPGKLFVVDGKALIDADAASFSPRDDGYDFYYVYQNKACATHPCVSEPILLVKTLKVTNAPARQVVYLAREGVATKTPVGRERYDGFHENDSEIPLPPFNWFHVTYYAPDGQKLFTHYPDGRRVEYLFQDADQSSGAWLTARNYRFTRNTDNGLQCIPLDIRLQPHTTRAYIEIVEIEDGLGGIPSPDEIERWDLLPAGGKP